MPASTGPVSLLHTSQLAPATLQAIRDMLDVAYEGDFAEADWEHALGGMHALVWDGDELVGHGSVVQRRMLHAARDMSTSAEARALSCGYIEAVAVHADRRRQGIGRAIMASLGDVVTRAYAMGALSASDEGRALYDALGWQAWRGRTFALTPTGMERTADEDEGILVLPVVALDLDGDLTCDWRDGDVW